MSDVEKGVKAIVADLSKEKKNLPPIIVEPLQDAINRGKGLPPAKSVFGPFITEFEHTILFARTGEGKTISAIQIAQSLALGIPIEGFTNEAEPMEVLYVDFEMHERQLASRYGESEDDFHENLYRMKVTDYAGLGEGSLSDLMLFHIESAIKQCGFKALVVDNVTWLCEDPVAGDESLSLMKALKSLQEKYELTAISLAHTPKIKDFVSITLQHLAGSAMIQNFVDAVVGIGKVFGSPDHRYFKQLKCRNGKLVHDFSNVSVVELGMVAGRLSFTFVENSPESALLRGQSVKAVVGPESIVGLLPTLFEKSANPWMTTAELDGVLRGQGMLKTNAKPCREFFLEKGHLVSRKVQGTNVVLYAVFEADLDAGEKAIRKSKVRAK